MYGAATTVAAFLKNARREIIRCFRFIVILPPPPKWTFPFESPITNIVLCDTCFDDLSSLRIAQDTGEPKGEASGYRSPDSSLRSE